MPVLSMKPHRLSVMIRKEGYEDENGDYHKGTEEWQLVGDCDAIPNGKEESIPYEDGSFGKYSYTVKLSPTCREFKKGERVRISFYKSSKEIEFEVLGFQRYQHQSKLWV